MKFSKFAIGITLLFSLSACADLPVNPLTLFSLSTGKQVVNNTYYSTRMPSIRVKVRQDLQFVDLIHEVRVPVATASGLEGSDSERNRSTTHYPIASATGSLLEQITFDKAIFRNRNNESELTIKNSVNSARAEDLRWDSPDYASYENILEHHDVTILRGRYAVGIYPYTSKSGAVRLVKKFGRIFGTSAKFEIYYSEKVSMDWGNARILNIKQNSFLKEFSRRADDSFEILAYARPSAASSAPQTGATSANIDSAIATAANEDTRTILEYIKHAGDSLDAKTRAGLIESALNTATNQNTRNILKGMK